jgi:hypothetical protein
LSSYQAVRALLKAIGVAIGAVGIALLAVVLLFVLMCSTGEKPGEGPNAAAGYHWGEPLIAALEVYRHDHSRYPDSLEALAPHYVARAALTPPPPLPGQVAYQRDAAGYSLTFFYTGPASNHCTYTPRRRRWDCYGAW